MDLWAGPGGPPPCREYSRLKLKPNGPVALRTPEQPEGRDDLTAHQQHRLQEDEEVHRRGRVLLQAAHCKGALVGWETPPTAMTLLLRENTEMLRDWNATCAHVAACQWGICNFPNLGFCVRMTQRSRPWLVGVLALLDIHPLQV